jgi:hypothetical protein
MSSYVLDRELLLSALGSGRVTSTQITTTTTQQAAAANSASNWIDATSNAALLGTTVYQRQNDAEIKKSVSDVRKFS